LPLRQAKKCEILSLNIQYTYFSQGSIGATRKESMIFVMKRLLLWIFLLFIDWREREREKEKRKESIRFIFCLVQWLTYREYAIKIRTSVLFSPVVLAYLQATCIYISIDLFGEEVCCSISRATRNILSYLGK
jgi:hypothetical protein